MGGPRGGRRGTQLTSQKGIRLTPYTLQLIPTPLALSLFLQFIDEGVE